MRVTSLTILAGALTASVACGSHSERPPSWEGTVDTLPSGQVVVRNLGEGVWRPGEEWRLEEEVRIGRLDGDGPDVFGNIGSLEVDSHGRFWILDSQAQELRVFSPTGEHVRTIGRRGGGPGEFAQAARVELGPDGNIWVMDPSNNRLSVFDSSGVLAGTHPALGGFMILPWPGRFDREGYYYSPVPLPGRDTFWIGLLRSDLSFSSADTIEVPTDPVERTTLTAMEGRIRATVPFQGGLTWRLTPAGTLLAMMSDEYRIFELDRRGDTIRTLTRAFTPLPVTSADHEYARENMEWFTDQGGRFDVSALPRVKPATRGFFLADDGHLWVARVTADRTDRTYDIFGPDGRFLGVIELPFALAMFPFPIVRGDLLHGVLRDELDVSYVVRARIERE